MAGPLSKQAEPECFGRDVKIHYLVHQKRQQISIRLCSTSNPQFIFVSAGWYMHASLPRFALSATTASHD